jgi:Na+-translocating ferredoxin:NAD+ oxidoreductase subunit E
MGIALVIVLTLSATVGSLAGLIVPRQVRIPAFITIIAFFVTAADLLMKAFLPDLSSALGIFVPLIIVNCIVLGRLEMYASKNSPIKAAADGLGMGLGFAAVLIVVGLIREILGSGKIILGGNTIITLLSKPIGLMVLPPGGFIVFGILLAFVTWLRKRQCLSEIARAKGSLQEEVLPENPPDEIAGAQLSGQKE